MNCKRVVVVAVVAALALGACSSDKKTGSTTQPGGSTAGAFTIYTTDGLKDIVSKLTKAYKTTHPTANIVVDTKATNADLRQVAAKPAPKIFLFIHPGIKDLHPSTPAVEFAENRAVIAVSTKNPKHVADLTAFEASSHLTTAMCGAKTGFGNITQWVMFKAKIKAASTVGEGCEASSMRKLLTNDLDAVLLFRASTYPPKGVTLLAIPEKQNIVFKISFEVLGTTAAAKAFGTFLAGPGAKQILKINGYLP